MPDIKSLLPAIDAWTASSLLQKAIRRGETEYAQAAAINFHKLRGNAIWRRLTLIAYEDIGIGDLPLCGDIARYAIDRNVRRQAGTDGEIILELTKRMSTAPKNRETDYLICTAKQATFTEDLRASVAGRSIAQMVETAADPRTPLLERATAAWMASGINGGGPRVLSKGDLPSLMRAFEEIGLPPGVSTAIEGASEKTLEPIVMMVALLWLAIRETREAPMTLREPAPRSVLCGGLPSYTFDKHTRLGKQAIKQLLRENSVVRDCIADFVPEYKAIEVASMAAFYADAIALNHRIIWTKSDVLFALGRKTDMTKIGTPDQGVEPITNIVLANLDQLNEIRRRLREAPRLFNGLIGAFALRDEA